ncbi:MAG: VWA domain-containing protein [Armatimonadetes bacterium]|nr:VWA domain-containing protein [Anaerolineae bacterium]
MAQFRFAHPWALGLLALLGALLVYRYTRDRWRGAPPALRYSDTRLFSGLPVGWRVRLRWLPDGLALTAWVLLVIALARPQTGSTREVLRGQGVDIVLALDISGSMAALDFPPGTRLDAAKRVMADFIKQRTFDRIGMVLFARTAFQQAPLTLDYDVLQTLLERVTLVTQVVNAQGNPLLLDGTAIGLGLASAGALLRDSSAPSRVIVLLTDGDNNTALDPLTAAQALAALGMRVYTIGMGTTGQVPIPDAQGNLIYTESDLDEPTLRQIADITGGLYYRAEDADGLARIYAEIDRLERSNVERQVFIPWQDAAQGLLMAALMVTVLERVLRFTVFRQTV